MILWGTEERRAGGEGGIRFDFLLSFSLPVSSNNGRTGEDDDDDDNNCVSFLSFPGRYE